MRALILVDIQNDFVPGGALAVAEGDRVVPVADAMQRHFDLIVATQDWHPTNHGSFAVNHPGRGVGDVIELDGVSQILWPVHCVQNTHGAEFVKSLDVSRVARVFQKGTDPAIDSYSGFFDNGHRRSTGMGEWLQGRGVKEVYVMGLATDYCVKFTVLDALGLGFRVSLIEDGCRGVNLKPKDSAKTITQMRSAGATIVNSRKLASKFEQEERPIVNWDDYGEHM